MTRKGEQYDGAFDLESLESSLCSGDRRALARAITLIESKRADHQAQGTELLERLYPKSGHAFRLAVTGAPGVGKSTLIEALGLHLVDLGYRPAVLAIDPSSSNTGGALLGDKTRMEVLSRSESAFIRPSPSGDAVGGVAPRTREAMLLCEASGFDPIIVETVGVGQTETAVAELADSVLLLLAPGGGDELQGLKRGIVELADFVLINKADGRTKSTANILAADYSAALSILGRANDEERVQVQTCSALEGEGVAEAWRVIEQNMQYFVDSGERVMARANQARQWFWIEVKELLSSDIAQESALAIVMSELENDVAKGKLLPVVAARRLLKEYRAAHKLG